ncbi:sister chromatid cohesion protein Dcc1 [Cyathus striatus]|nr:sister chromatid cohesion protein Dcc1 [Cyathus striatus]
MPEYNLNFSSHSLDETGSFKLLELPPELNSIVESALNQSENYTFTVKGNSSEDAVLCTKDKTYSMRSVGLSNSVLIITGSTVENKIEIHDQVSEIIELMPAVPKLHKLRSLLRGMEYGEDEETQQSRTREKAFTLNDAKSVIQASDEELSNGLKQQRILVIDGELRPISSSYLSHILELILNLLISMSIPHSAASVDDITSVLADEYEISRSVSAQVMSWFGDIHEGTWNMNVISVTKEIGLGILRESKHNPIEKQAFLERWKSHMGDTFLSSVSLKTLSGNFLETSKFGDNTSFVSYFPSSALPIDPAARFTDLFITRSRWKGDDIAPFLADIAVNSKERDKLLLKYCRAITDPQGIWYTARTQYNG